MRKGFEGLSPISKSGFTSIRRPPDSTNVSFQNHALGLEISRATLDGWVLKVGELLIPMVAAMRQELISGSYIQADETPVDVQMREGRGKNHQAYLWQYSRPGGSVVFDFRLGRGRDGPKRFLGHSGLNRGTRRLLPVTTREHRLAFMLRRTVLEKFPV